ncbi:MAG TPA: anthrone oxygenase family protein [Euzebyales bacterium]|nr:anthrone oxygenase family protein [Euzebyales bacterium]
MKTATAVLVIATLAMGLFAGLFYTYATSIMVGLKRTDDRVFVAAMQWFNATIGTVWFAFSFVGSAVLTIVAAVLHLGGDRRVVLPWIVAALVCYGVTFVITVVVNVPLNNELAAAGAPDRLADVAAVRERFEGRWVRWNIARAMASTAALGCLLWALVLHGAL